MKKFIILLANVLFLMGITYANENKSVMSINTTLSEQLTNEVLSNNATPDKVWYYSYDYKTGKSTCMGYGYVRYEGGRLIIYLEGRNGQGRDYNVSPSNLKGYKYMFTYRRSYDGQYVIGYFNY